MRQIEAHYEKGSLKPNEPLALRQGEAVRLIIVRSTDPSRWNLERLAKRAPVEESELTEQGLSEWANTLDKDDRR